MNGITNWIKSHPKESIGALIVGLSLLWYLLKSGGGSGSGTTPVGAFGTGLTGSQYLQLSALNEQGLNSQNQANVQLVQLADQTDVQKQALASQLQLGLAKEDTTRQSIAGGVKVALDNNSTQETIAQGYYDTQYSITNLNDILASVISNNQTTVQRESIQEQGKIQSQALNLQASAQDAANRFAQASVSANKSGRTASGVASIIAALENPATAPGTVAANQPYEVASNFQTSSIFSSLGKLAQGLFGFGGLSTVIP